MWKQTLKGVKAPIGVKLMVVERKYAKRVPRARNRIGSTKEKCTNGPWRTRTGHAEDRRRILRKCDGVHRNAPKRAGMRQSARSAEVGFEVRCKDSGCIVKRREIGPYAPAETRVSTSPGDLATDCPHDLPLNKMAPFNSSLLAFSPTPEPVMRPTSPAKEAGSPVQEVPETEQQKLLRSWVALLQALDTQVKIIPGDGPELFEDRETWTRGWSQLSVQLAESATIAEHLKMGLEFDNVGRTILEEGDLRDQGEGCRRPPPRTPPHPKHLLQKMVAEVILPVSKDSGGKLVESGGHPEAPSCLHCQSMGLKCDGEPGHRCPACASARRPCSFSHKRKPKKAGAPCKAGSAPNASLLAGSVPGSVRRPASSVAKDVMDVDSSGSGESEVEEKEVPIRAIKALPSRTVKADKGKGKGSVPSVPTNGADEVESEVERLRAENEHLKNIIRSMRQSGRSQQSRLIALSNQTYTMSTELARLDDELAFLN
ncbi:hypothetical protein F4604DRAFT_1685094 [Suillus subluteus]|nr:hypothetical protein F4604DRAFT_1685094 [Suillus subluteus]